MDKTGVIVGMEPLTIGMQVWYPVLEFYHKTPHIFLRTQKESYIKLSNSVPA